jgi:hypothetical protein
MRCNEIDLIGYIDRTVKDDKVIKHISECPNCADEIKELSYSLKLLQSYFAKQLNKCPSYSKIIDLFYNVLPLPETTRLQKHLKLCSKCSLIYNKIEQFEQRLVKNEDKFDPFLLSLSEPLKEKVKILHDRSIINRLDRSKKIFSRYTNNVKSQVKEALNKEIYNYDKEPAFASRKDLMEVKKKFHIKRKKKKI